MQFKLKIHSLPSDDEKDMFMVNFSTYKQQIQGKFEKSELREIIETIDNAIHH